jgi:hypothetical protein
VIGVGGVGVVGFEGIVMIGELGDVLPPPPQAESSTHAASALRRRRFNQLPPVYMRASLPRKYAGNLATLMIVNVDLTASTHTDCAGCISFQSVIRSSAGKHGA